LQELILWSKPDLGGLVTSKLNWWGPMYNSTVGLRKAVYDWF
jgi:hypothetical protein